MKETLIRTLTGILFVSILLAGVLLHPCAYLMLFSLILILSWFELLRLRKAPAAWIRWPGAFTLILSQAVVFLVLNATLSPWWLLTSLLFPALMFVLYFRGIQNPKATLGMIFSGLYLLVGTGSFHLLGFGLGEHTDYRPRLILVLLILLWTGDTMAYVFGRLLGKHPIWRSVSPSKTWEGLAGGLLFSFLAALILNHYYGTMAPGDWMGLALVVSLGGTAGDLIESAQKRRAGLKDSGRLLPGHGGILDRFDSALLAAPLASLYLYIMI